MKIGYGVILLLLFILIPLAHTLYMQEGYELLAENGYKKLGNNMNAKECQEECLKMKNCKYVNRPRKHKGKIFDSIRQRLNIKKEDRIGVLLKYIADLDGIRKTNFAETFREWHTILTKK